MTNSSKVIINGKSVDFDAAVELMDDVLRETLSSESSENITNQEFADKYCDMHSAKFFGETFQVN